MKQWAEVMVQATLYVDLSVRAAGAERGLHGAPEPEVELS